MRNIWDIRVGLECRRFLVMIGFMFFAMAITSRAALAISPADYCAARPQVACELLNSTITVDRDTGGVAPTAFLASKRYCKSGQFRISFFEVRKEGGNIKTTSARSLNLQYSGFSGNHLGLTGASNGEIETHGLAMVTEFLSLCE